MDKKNGITSSTEIALVTSCLFANISKGTPASLLSFNNLSNSSPDSLSLGLSDELSTTYI